MIVRISGAAFIGGMFFVDTSADAVHRLPLENALDTSVRTVDARRAQATGTARW